MKKPKRSTLKPIYVNVVPIENNHAGLIVMVDELGNTYIKVLPFSLSPMDMQAHSWIFVGNPL